MAHNSTYFKALPECEAVLVEKTNMHELGIYTSRINTHYGLSFLNMSLFYKLEEFVCFELLIVPYKDGYIFWIMLMPHVHFEMISLWLSFILCIFKCDSFHVSNDF